MKKPMFLQKSGIYQIRNTVNNKTYIGQTTNLATRRYNHFALLRKNKSHNPHLQSAYNKYGEENFVFEVLIYCNVNQLDCFEQEFVNRLCPAYNIRTDVLSNRGHVVTEETRRKISSTQKGRPKSEEIKKKISKSLTGRKGSYSQIESARQRFMGNKLNLGRKQSQEEKDKRANSIRKFWEGKRRITPSWAGQKISNALLLSNKTLRGEKNPNAVLTEGDVMEIRHLCSENIITKAEASRRFGVSQTMIGKIVKRKVWKHVA